MITMRSICISQVLGTDMKKHFQILSAFQVLIHTHLHPCGLTESAASMWCSQCHLHPCLHCILASIADALGDTSPKIDVDK